MHHETRFPKFNTRMVVFIGFLVFLNENPIIFVDLWILRYLWIFIGYQQTDILNLISFIDFDF